MLHCDYRLPFTGAKKLAYSRCFYVFRVFYDTLNFHLLSQLHQLNSKKEPDEVLERRFQTGYNSW